jgi:hypothetical protein
MSDDHVARHDSDGHSVQSARSAHSTAHSLHGGDGLPLKSPLEHADEHDHAAFEEEDHHNHHDGLEEASRAQSALDSHDRSGDVSADPSRPPSAVPSHGDDKGHSDHHGSGGAHGAGAQAASRQGRTHAGFIKASTSKDGSHAKAVPHGKHGQAQPRKTHQKVHKKEKQEVVIDPSQQHRRTAKADITVKEEKKTTEEEDLSQLDEIERIIRKREKLISIPIPPAPANAMNSGHRIKSVIIPEKDMFHLLHEVKGTRYGPPCRPELTLVVVGKGATSQYKETNEPSLFPGVELIADFAKELFVLSDRIEDQLVMLTKIDPNRAKIIDSAITRCENESWSYKDTSMTRCWKRFVINFLEPMAQNKIRMIVFDARQKRFRDAEMAEWGYMLAHPM